MPGVFSYLKLVLLLCYGAKKPLFVYLKQITKKRINALLERTLHVHTYCILYLSSVPWLTSDSKTYGS